MIRYCAGQHDGTVIITVPIDAPPFCCDDCASDEHPDPCECDASGMSAPHVGALPAYHPLAGKS